MSGIFNLMKLDYNFEGFKIYNPSIKEMFDLFEDEETLISVLQILTMPLMETLKLTGNAKFSEFQLFQTLLLSPKKEIAGITQHQRLKLLDFLLLLFPNFKMEIFNEHFIFRKEDSVLLISDKNFDAFKKILCNMFDLKTLLRASNKSQNDFNPVNKKSEEIAKKIEAGRKKVAELKGEVGGSIFENYLSVLSVGFSIPADILSEHLTIYSLIKTYKRYMAKVAWDMDIQCRLAGGSPQDEPENWMASM